MGSLFFGGRFFGRFVGAARGGCFGAVRLGTRVVVPLAAGLPCGARGEVGPSNSLRALWALRSNNSGQSDDEARCACPPRHCAPRHHPGAQPHSACALFRLAGGVRRVGVARGAFGVARRVFCSVIGAVCSVSRAFWVAGRAFCSGRRARSSVHAPRWGVSGCWSSAFVWNYSDRVRKTMACEIGSSGVVAKQLNEQASW